MKTTDGSRARPTAHDVARQAGVSQSAVSRAFTPGTSITADLRRRVLDAARAIGYQPNHIARSLSTRRTRTIGVAIGYMENQFYPAVLEQLSARFQETGHHVLLFTPPPHGDPDPLLEDVLRCQVDAIILASARLTSRFSETCAQARVPVVLINRRTETTSVSSVTGDNHNGARKVAEFLIAGGHRRYAYVAGLEDSSTSHDREAGYTQALTRAGLASPVRVPGLYATEATRDAARQMLSGADRPDAVFCANDHMAFAVIDVARAEFGLDVGRELSVVGFDDVALAAWPSFRLTTYAQPIPEMVERVVALTLGHLAEPHSPSVHETIAGRLVVRSSARIP